MRDMRRHLLLVPLVAVLLTGAVACTGGKDEPASSLPAGDDLVRAAAEAMKTVRTAHFDIEANGTVAGVPLRRARGAITQSGDAEGTAQIDQSGPLAELSFVIKGQTLHLKGVTGGWQTVPLALAASVYDPSKILDPQSGVANLLATASGARTEAREAVNGADSYRVAATFKGDALSKLVPGVTADVPGQLWIGADRRVLHQGRFTVPAQDGGQPATVTVTFTDFDAPVTINEP